MSKPRKQTHAHEEDSLLGAVGSMQRRSLPATSSSAIASSVKADEIRTQAIFNDFSILLAAQRKQLMENMGNNVQARRILLRFNGSGTWSKGVASEVEKMQRTLIKAAQTAGLRKPQIMSVQPNSFSVAYSEARMVNSNPSRELKEYGLALQDLESEARRFYSLSIQLALNTELKLMASEQLASPSGQPSAAAQVRSAESGSLHCPSSASKGWGGGGGARAPVSPRKGTTASRAAEERATKLRGDFLAAAAAFQASAAEKMAGRAKRREEQRQQSSPGFQRLGAPAVIRESSAPNEAVGTSHTSPTGSRTPAAHTTCAPSSRSDRDACSLTSTPNRSRTTSPIGARKSATENACLSSQASSLPKPSTASLPDLSSSEPSSRPIGQVHPSRSLQLPPRPVSQVDTVVHIEALSREQDELIAGSLAGENVPTTIKSEKKTKGAKKRWHATVTGDQVAKYELLYDTESGFIQSEHPFSVLYFIYGLPVSVLSHLLLSIMGASAALQIYIFSRFGPSTNLIASALGIISSIIPVLDALLTTIGSLVEGLLPYKMRSCFALPDSSFLCSRQFISWKGHLEDFTTTIKARIVEWVEFTARDPTRHKWHASRLVGWTSESQLHLFQVIVEGVHQTPTRHVVALIVSATAAITTFGVTVLASVTPAVICISSLVAAALAYDAMEHPGPLGSQIRRSPIMHVAALGNALVAVRSGISDLATSCARMLAVMGRSFVMIYEAILVGQSPPVDIARTIEAISVEYRALALCVAGFTLLGSVGFVRRVIRRREYERAQACETRWKEMKKESEHAVEQMKLLTRQEQYWVRATPSDDYEKQPLLELEERLGYVSKGAGLRQSRRVARNCLNEERVRRQLVAATCEQSVEDQAKKASSRRSASAPAIDPEERELLLKLEQEKTQEAAAAIRDAARAVERASQSQLTTAEESNQAHAEADAREANAMNVANTFSPAIEAAMERANARVTLANEAERSATQKRDSLEAAQEQSRAEQKAMKAKAERALELASKSKDDAAEAFQAAEQQALAVKAAQEALNKASSNSASRLKEFVDHERECDELTEAVAAKRRAAQEAMQGSTPQAEFAASEYVMAAMRAEEAATALAETFAPQVSAAREAEKAATAAVVNATELEVKRRTTVEVETKDSLQSVEVAESAQRTRQCAADEVFTHVESLAREFSVADASAVTAAKAKEVGDQMLLLASTFQEKATRATADAVTAGAAARLVQEKMDIVASYATGTKEAADELLERAEDLLASRERLEAAVVVTNEAARGLVDCYNASLVLETARSSASEASLTTQRLVDMEGDALANERKVQEEKKRLEEAAARFAEAARDAAARADASARAAEELSPSAVAHAKTVEALQVAEVLAVIAIRKRVEADVMTAEVEVANSHTLTAASLRVSAHCEVERARDEESKRHTELHRLEALDEEQDLDMIMDMRQDQERRAQLQVDTDQLLKLAAADAFTSAEALMNRALEEATVLIQSAANASIAAGESYAAANASREALAAAEDEFEAIELANVEPAAGDFEQILDKLRPDLKEVVRESTEALHEVTVRFEKESADYRATQAARSAVEEASQQAIASLEAIETDIIRAKDNEYRSQKRAAAAAKEMAAAKEIAKLTKESFDEAARAFQEANVEAVIGHCFTTTVDEVLSEVVAKAASDLAEQREKQEKAKLAMLEAEAAEKAAKARAIELAEAAQRAEMGGFVVGDEVYYLPVTTRVRRDGNRLLHGARGFVLSLVRDQLLAVQFPIEKGHMVWNCAVDDLSYEPPQPLAGGYVLGERVFLAPPKRVFAEGDIPQGEVVGLPGPYANARDHLDQMVAVRIDMAAGEGNSSRPSRSKDSPQDRRSEDNVRAIYVSSLSRTRPPQMPKEASTQDSFRRSGSVRV